MNTIMNYQVFTFIAGILLTGAASLAVVFYMKRHLKPILVEICGTEQRAGFWVAFTNVTLVIFPLIFAMHFRPDLGTGTPLPLQITRQLEWAFIGMLGGVLCVGLTLAGFIRDEMRGRKSASYMSKQVEP